MTDRLPLQERRMSARTPLTGRSHDTDADEDDIVSVHSRLSADVIRDVILTGRGEDKTLGSRFRNIIRLWGLNLTAIILWYLPDTFDFIALNLWMRNDGTFQHGKIEYIAALGLGKFIMYFFVWGLMHGLFQSLDYFISTNFGRGNVYSCAIYLGQAQLVAFCAAPFFWLLMYNGEGVFLLLGQDPAISQLAGEYSAAMCFCFPMVFLADIYYEFLINVDGFFFEMQCVQLVGNIQHVVMAYFLLQHTTMAPGTVLGLCGAVTYAIFCLGFQWLYVRWMRENRPEDEDFIVRSRAVTPRGMTGDAGDNSWDGGPTSGNDGWPLAADRSPDADSRGSPGERARHRGSWEMLENNTGPRRNNNYGSLGGTGETMSPVGHHSARNDTYDLVSEIRMPVGWPNRMFYVFDFKNPHIYSFRSLKKFFEIALSQSCVMLLEVGFPEFATIMVGWMSGSMALPVYATFLRFYHGLALLSAEAMSCAVGQIVGRSLGEMRPLVARWYTIWSLVGCGMVALLFLWACVYFREAIAKVYLPGGNEDILELFEMSVVLVFVFGWIPEVLETVGYGVLRACGKTALCAQLYFIQFIVIGAPLYYFAVTKGTLWHVWMSMNIVSTFGGLATIFMLSRLDYEEECKRACSKAFAEGEDLDGLDMDQDLDGIDIALVDAKTGEESAIAAKMV